ncbi:site-specific integrase [Solibacillus isronensis]|uniref:site-specific integrase n=1 Tax=Solibacillus isronensis TaxID=412383 RepID=UPI0009A79567|nr:site-specific integrase [Solibacillus isronensis]
MAKKKTGSIESYILKNGEKRYRFQIYIGMDPLTGKEIRTTRSKFKTKKEAELALARLKLEIANGQYKKIQAETYQDVYDLWVKVYENTVEESTFVKTLGIFRNHILPAMGAYKIDKINVAICQRHVDEWMEKLVNGDKTKSYASLVMRFAIKRDYIQSNPFDLVDLPRQRKKSSTKQETENFYTKAQLRLFLQCAEKQPNYKVYAFFRLLAYSGMRKGEALALNWEDINFKDNEISINKAIGQGVSQRLYIKPTKTATKRAIKMDEATMIILKEWKKKQQQAYLMLGYNTLQKNQLVFSNTKNSFIQPTKTNDWLKSIIIKNNLPAISTHGFRHTHCSLLFEAGATIKSVQDRLGHTDVKTTMDVYTHVTSTAKEDAIIKFTNHLK